MVCTDAEQKNKKVPKKVVTIPLLSSNRGYIIKRREIKKMKFIEFKNKNWGYAGDKKTWAAIDKDGNFVIQRAAKGIISGAFESEMREFCADKGVDWDAINCGQRVVVSNK